MGNSSEVQASSAAIPEGTKALPFPPLPYERHSLSSLRLDASFLEVSSEELPLRLWDVHRVLQFGGTANLGTVDALAPSSNNEFLDNLFSGAGFTPSTKAQWLANSGSLFVRAANTGHKSRELVLRSERTLADTVGPNMQILLVGLNPSLHAAEAGVAFCTSGNRAWPALAAAGLADAGVANSTQDPVSLLVARGIGMTDLVKRATAKAEQVADQEFQTGILRLQALCRLLKPRVVCVLGLSGWRAAVSPRATAGVQPTKLGGRPVYLMPNPSGLNTHSTLASLTQHLQCARDLARATA